MTASPLVAVILICSAEIAVQDCSVDNVTDITRGESASTVCECLASGQPRIASTVLGPFSWSPPDPPVLAFFIGDPSGGKP
jgi:hypothetical protein